MRINLGPRILIIEDEPAIADTLIYALRTEGFTPEWCRTGHEGLASLGKKPVALVILDVGLPDGSGFEFCKAIRVISAVPLIFLTARTAELDRVLGLELGGDDYLVKPFSPRELTSRVKAVLRRTHAGTAPASGAPAQTVRAAIPDLSVDAERCAVTYCGAELSLTRYEFRLLRTLVTHPGRVFSREQLMTQVWEEPDASFERTVDAHIKTLRAKLRAVRKEPDPIQTHRGMGYSLRSLR